MGESAMISAAAPSTPKITLLAEGETGCPRVSGNGKVVVWSQMVDGHSVILKHEDGATNQISEDGYDCVNPCLSNDGSVIAYARYTPSQDEKRPGGSFDVYQYRDGENTPVAAGPGNEYEVEISKDGSTIAWDDDMDGSWLNWRVGKWHGGETTYLTNGDINSEFPFIAGDTNQVYFHQSKSGRVRLATEGPNGSIITAATGPGDLVWPDVTDDGKSVMWTDNSRVNDQILRQTDGQLATDVQQDGVDCTWARMSGDGSRMTWTQFDRRVADPSQPVASVAYRENGQTETLAVGDVQGFPSMPDLSDDGKTLTWLWVANEEGAHTRVYMCERGSDEAPAPPSEPSLATRAQGEKL